MYVKELPIPEISNEVKDLLSNKVDSLLQLHKEIGGNDTNRLKF